MVVMCDKSYGWVIFSVARFEHPPALVNVELPTQQNTYYVVPKQNYFCD